jgi:WD40 repeat protein
LLLLLPQVPEVQHPDPVAYVRLHREADEALSARRPAEARQAFEGCLELSRENPAVAYGLACAEALAGNTDAALDWLSRAADWGYADAAVAEWDEDLAALRATPRFAEVLERMRALDDEAGVASPYRVYDDESVSYAMDAAIDDTGQLVAVALTNGKVLVLDAETGRRLSASPRLESAPWAVTFKPGTRTLAVLTREGEIFLWPVEPTAEESDVPGAIAKLPDGPPGLSEWFLPLFEFDPTGERLLVATTARGALLVSSDGNSPFAWGQPGRFTPQVTWSDEGSEIASWSRSEVVFRDGRTGKLSRRLDALSEVASVAFQPRGSLIATGHQDTCLRFWDRGTLELVREPEIVFPAGCWIEPESDFPLSMNSLGSPATAATWPLAPRRWSCCSSSRRAPESWCTSTTPAAAGPVSRWTSTGARTTSASGWPT